MENGLVVVEKDEDCRDFFLDKVETNEDIHTSENGIYREKEGAIDNRVCVFESSDACIDVYGNFLADYIYSYDTDTTDSP